MHTIMSPARRTILFTLAGLILAAAVPSTVFAQSAAKIEVWRVNLGKSTFSSTAGTLVLEQSKGAAEIDSNGYPAAHKFLLLSSGKLYLATDDGTSGNAAANSAYSRWAGLKLSQIGQVTSGYDCGFRCQFGLIDTRPTTMRIVFMTTPETVAAMRAVDVLAFDRR